MDIYIDTSIYLYLYTHTHLCYCNGEYNEVVVE